MPSHNKIILMGYLAADPELRYVGDSNAAICNSSIGVNDKNDTMFIDLTIWGKTAENFNQWLKKGDLVLVEGKLKLDQWIDKQTGNKRRKHSLVVYTFSNLSSKKSVENNANYPPETPVSETDFNDDGLPF